MFLVDDEPMNIAGARKARRVVISAHQTVLLDEPLKSSRLAGAGRAQAYVVPREANGFAFGQALDQFSVGISIVDDRSSI